LSIVAALCASFASTAALAAPKKPTPPPAAKPSPPAPAPAAPPPATDPKAAAPADPPKEKPSPAAPAGPPNAYLAGAKTLYAGFQFDGILPKLEFALAVKGVTSEQKVEIYKLMAFTHAAFDDQAKAEDSFLKLLRVDPSFEIAGVSPKIRGYFVSAQKAYKASLTVKLKHDPPKATDAGATTTVDVMVTAGQERVKTLTLHYRLQAEKGGGAYSQINMTGGDTGAYSAPVPTLFPGPAGKRKVEYFMRARGTAKELLAAVGDEAAPLVMDVEAMPDTPRPVYKSPWFWTGAGVAVAATAVALPVLLSTKNAVAPAGSLGKERLK
jgi:hypothetical protein